jgi:hypothetical protein
MAKVSAVGFIVFGTAATLLGGYLLLHSIGKPAGG